MEGEGRIGLGQMIVGDRREYSSVRCPMRRYWERGSDARTYERGGTVNWRRVKENGVRIVIDCSEVTARQAKKRDTAVRADFRAGLITLEEAGG
jgi:hypothetical protein